MIRIFPRVIQVLKKISSHSSKKSVQLHVKKLICIMMFCTLFIIIMSLLNAHTTGILIWVMQCSTNMEPQKFMNMLLHVCLKETTSINYLSYQNIIWGCDQEKNSILSRFRMSLYHYESKTFLERVFSTIITIRCHVIWGARCVKFSLVPNIILLIEPNRKK